MNTEGAFAKNAYDKIISTGFILLSLQKIKKYCIRLATHPSITGNVWALYVKLHLPVMNHNSSSLTPGERLSRRGKPLHSDPRPFPTAQTKATRRWLRKYPHYRDVARVYASEMRSAYPVVKNKPLPTLTSGRAWDVWDSY